MRGLGAMWRRGLIGTLFTSCVTSFSERATRLSQGSFCSSRIEKVDGGGFIDTAECNIQLTMAQIGDLNKQPMAGGKLNFGSSW